MLWSFVWVLIFGFLYVGCKSDAEISKTADDGYWHGWFAAMLLNVVCELLVKLAGL